MPAAANTNGLMELVKFLKNAQPLDLNLGNVVAMGQQDMPVARFDIGQQEIPDPQVLEVNVVLRPGRIGDFVIGRVFLGKDRLDLVQ